MAVPVYQSSGAASNVALPTDPTPSYPASIAAGDLLLLFVFIRQATSATMVDPSGWTRIYDDSNYGNNSSFVLAKKATGSESGTLTVDCTGTAGNLVQAVISRVTGWNDTGTITDAFEGNVRNTGTGTTDTAANLTTASADCLGVAWRRFGASIATSVEAYTGGATTWGQQFESGTTTGNNGTIHIDSTNVPTSGTTIGGTDAITSATWLNRVFAIKSPGASAFSIDANPGSYAVTGAAATLVAGRVVSADPGSYAVTGSAATLVAARLLSLNPGSYAITGDAASLVAGLALSADPGTYAVNGADAGLSLGLFIAADPGTYTITGVDAGLVAGLALSANPGVYVITGLDAALVLTVPAGDPGTVIGGDRQDDRAFGGDRADSYASAGDRRADP